MTYRLATIQTVGQTDRQTTHHVRDALQHSCNTSNIVYDLRPIGI